MAIAYDVFLFDDFEFEEIDTVWDNETDPSEVRKSLINHDGYSPNIIVRASNSDEDLQEIYERQVAQ